MSEEAVWILTRDDVDTEDEDGRKGWGRDAARKFSVLKAKLIDPEYLRNEWGRSMRLVGQLIRDAEKEAGGELGMQLDEVTVAVEINGKGQVNLMGACSSETNGKGAITLKFKRVSQS
jgi:hypothetical protein